MGLDKSQGGCPMANTREGVVTCTGKSQGLLKQRISMADRSFESNV